MIIYIKDDHVFAIANSSLVRREVAEKCDYVVEKAGNTFEIVYPYCKRIAFTFKDVIDYINSEREHDPLIPQITNATVIVYSLREFFTHENRMPLLEEHEQ